MGGPEVAAQEVTEVAGGGVIRADVTGVADTAVHPAVRPRIRTVSRTRTVNVAEDAIIVVD